MKIFLHRLRLISNVAITALGFKVLESGCRSVDQIEKFISTFYRKEVQYLEIVRAFI